jgi:hypothetical protein
MKIYIGPHRSWFGPYQLSAKILFWMNKDDNRIHKFGEWLAGDSGKLLNLENVLNEDIQSSKLCKFLSWIDSKKKRKVKVRIDKYDTWNVDGTLAYIILPMLKQLQATKHGSPSGEYDWKWKESETEYPNEITGKMEKCSQLYHGPNHTHVYDSEGAKKHTDRMDNGFKLFGKYYRSLWD